MNLNINNYQVKLELESGTLEAFFTLSNPFRMYHVGKSWPRRTDCKIYYNGALLGEGNVTKHAIDKGSDKVGILKSAKKAIENALPGRINKLYRKELWELIKNI